MPLRATMPAILALLGALVAQATQRAPTGSGAEWPMFRHDEAGTGHSPLKQITRDNVGAIRESWRYRLQGDIPAAAAPAGGARPLNSEATPIVVDGVMYVPAANRVVALDPESGKELWQFAAAAPSRRGVAYWRGDATRPPRIIFAAGRRLIALRAKTGEPEP